MASRSEEDLRCPVCQDIFRDPVVLVCSHSFCKDCLQTWWRQKPSRECPVCKTISSNKNPPVSLVLKNLCEAFLLERDQRGAEELCPLHAEKLKLFCLDHQELVCLVCRDSEEHANHSFRPTNEAAREPRQKLQETLASLKEKLESLKQGRITFDAAAVKIQIQTRHTERQIKEQFKKLHQFLQEEEEARLLALREEEEQKSQRMKEQIRALSREISALSDTIRVTEDELKAEDFSFLKNYKATVERVEQRPPLEDPQLPTNVIDQAKHLGNLSFNIWNKMKDLVSYTPVILDPKRTYPELVLSDDLTSITGRRGQQPSNHPDLVVDFWPAVGFEGFNSGTHSWDVEVGDSVFWFLGVLAEKSVQRKIIKSGLWGVVSFKGKCITRSPLSQSTFLSVLKQPKRVRVTLDCDRGALMFSDIDMNTHIHTFTHTFADRMFPFMATGQRLKILPVEICVKPQQV
ncbi:E3 ubiquitin-protein ligase TRIM35-like [Cheilinus undulatus]|uniref:E3 ubiquitin-protein ligase TRIM35-like n=1 Tax=Cheilinus undulatus TaxID=241271 RepID=UPI001BD50E6F|nr:E3 ubiquitin-protein ligase TRIM35-like [Cheilinus undulatus]